VSVRRRMLGLDVGLVSNLDVGLGLMSDLDIGLGYRRRFSVASRRPIGRARSDIRV